VKPRGWCSAEGERDLYYRFRCTVTHLVCYRGTSRKVQNKELEVEEYNTKINDWGARTRRGTVRNHSAAVGAAAEAVFAGAVPWAQLVRYTLQQVGKPVGNYTVQVVPVVV
jgi:hypothetical protein